MYLSSPAQTEPSIFTVGQKSRKKVTGARALTDVLVWYGVATPSFNWLNFLCSNPQEEQVRN
jgi:hypothetical protein